MSERTSARSSTRAASTTGSSTPFSVQAGTCLAVPTKRITTRLIGLAASCQRASACGQAAARAALHAAGHTAIIKPMPLRTPVPGGFTSDDFAIDFDARTVTCPADHTVKIRAGGGAAFQRFCRTCPLASQCTTAKDGRKLTLTEYEPLLRTARSHARDPLWQAEYRQHRPMVERSIAWLTRGNRKVRYRGITRNDRWLHHRSAALNLRRLITMGLTHTGTTWAIA